ncbi:MAG: hypothetical protein ACKOWJ_06560 [Micrococcales bacterium]
MVSQATRFHIGPRGFNTLEFLVVVTHGGRAVHPSISRIDVETVFEKPMDEYAIAENAVYRLQELFQVEIEKLRLVPRTRVRVFAEYLATTPCATARTLAQHAGIATTTAHRWLAKATGARLLDRFASLNENFYFNRDAIRELFSHSNVAREVFNSLYAAELRELRAMPDWIRQSRLATSLHLSKWWYRHA